MELENLWEDWKIDKLIGEGSFGKVYKIVRKEFGHTYEAALKVIHIPQNQAEVESVFYDGMDEKSISIYFKGIVEDIVNEFALMSQLKGNTNIVSYEDHRVVPRKDIFGWDIYIRMELLTPLFEYIKENGISIRDVICLGIDICRALEVCQKYNIIHRDIKPENIFVSKLGYYKLGDFGIARQLEKTSSGLSKKGTYSYMAPEVYKGLEYNSTVDIYSLGIVLYRFLNNNRTPFMPPYPKQIHFSDKENANLLRIGGKQIPSPCNAKGRLAEIVLKACAYDPKERYESARVMREELQDILYSVEEKEFIYPHGDELKNIDNASPIYLVHTEVKETDNVVELRRDDNNKTMYLFQGSEKFKREKKEEEIEKAEEEIEKAEEEIEKAEEEIEKAEEEIEKAEEEIEKAEEEIEKAEEEEIEKAEEEEEIEKQKELGRKEEKKFVCTKKESEEKSIKSHKKKVFLILLLILGTALLGGYIYKESLKRVVPSVINLSVSKAKAEFSKEDLVLIKEKEEYSDTIKKGRIISQSYKAKEIVKKGTKVSVVISKGALLTVPDLKGISEEDARKMLESMSLALEVSEKNYSDTIVKDGIINQVPMAGEKLEEGNSVKVVLSKGEELMEIPDVVGKTIQDAKKKIIANNLKIQTKDVYSDSVDSGKIVTQSVEPEKKVKKNTKIILEVSIGSRPKPKVTQKTTKKVETSKTKNKISKPKKKQKEKTDDSWKSVN